MPAQHRLYTVDRAVIQLLRLLTTLMILHACDASQQRAMGGCTRLTSNIDYLCAQAMHHGHGSPILVLPLLDDGVMAKG